MLKFLKSYIFRKKFVRNLIKRELKRTHHILIKDVEGMKRKRRIKLPVWGDYVRISMLELIANEIYEKNIDGAVAELGVFQGDFAKLINEVFPDRMLYLFDTFSGFDRRDALYDKKHGYSINLGDYSKTSINTVLEKLPSKDKCIIKDGYFPETTKGIDDNFCFVSIDVDLYKPTYEGLNYFYPRLNKGGYIFIHDYVRGVKSAVREFCEKQKINYIPLTDTWQSVILAK